MTLDKMVPFMEAEKPVTIATDKSPKDLGKPTPPIIGHLSTRQWILAVCLLMIFVALTTGQAQLTNLAFKNLDFNAPFLFVLFKTAFRALGFPIYLIVNTIVKLICRRKIHFGRTWRRCNKVCGENGLTVRFLFVKVFPATIFNLGVQLSYTFGIAYLTPSLTSSLNPPAVATSYLMGWWFLRQRILTVKIFFVLVTFAGVIIIVEDKVNVIGGVNTKILIGIIAMISNDLCLSTYQIFFKKAFPKGDIGQVSFAVSLMYGLMLLIYWPVPIILTANSVEIYNITLLPYDLLIGAWSCTAVSAMVYNYGIVVAGGFFMGLSDLIVLAANSVIDATFRNITIPRPQIIGTVVITVAFIFMVLPDSLLNIDFKKLYGKKNQCPLTQETTSSPSTSNLNANEDLHDDGLDAPQLERLSINDEDVLENAEVLGRERTFSIP